MFNNIQVKKLIDPDKIAPTVVIHSTATVLNGDNDFLLTYNANDNAGGSGIKRLDVYYSPDGNSSNFKFIGNGPTGANVSVPICVPNKNHPQPMFKIVATDKTGNKATQIIGEDSGAPFSITPSEPINPTLTSSRGLITNQLNTQLEISACPKTQCSQSSLKYEGYPNDVYLFFNDSTQPAALDAGWVSCQNILSNQYTTPDFIAQGPYTYKVWTKTSEMEFDGTTSLNLVSSTSNSITVIYDNVLPTISVNNLTTVAGGVPVDVTFVASDLNNISNNKIQYAADGVTFVDVADNITSPYSWTPPLSNIATAKIKIITTDTAGNINEATNNAFTIDSINPSAPVATRISPYITSSTTVTATIADCLDKDKILINESPIAPATTDSNWQNCSTLPAGISQAMTGPVIQGLHTLYVWAKDPGGNISASNSFDVIYDTIAPTINLTAFGTLYKGGDPITLQLSTTDTNGVSSFVLAYAEDGITYSNIATLATNATSYNWTIPVANTSAARFRLTSVDNATTANTRVVISSNFTIDTTPPSTASLFVEGTSITGKSYGSYRINDCSDVTHVKIVRGGSTTPLATDSGWQTCTDAAYALNTNDFVSGLNSLKFWVKDGANNVAPAYLSYDTTYNPPTFHVVNGPTISTAIADITIQFCDEASITQVLFNETAIMPIAADTKWQSCNTAIGALKSETLSPGPHTLKAYFKYADGVQSPNPIDVYVNYTATLSWAEPPSVNRPQTKFTLATCTGIDQIFLRNTGGAPPLATDPNWQPCSTAAGALNFNGLNTGVNTVTVFFKDSGNNLFANTASTTATYNPPQAILNDGSTVQTANAQLTISDCQNISQVLVSLDDATSPIGGDPRWVTCSTANNAISSPALGTSGSHTLYTWFKYTDNYILPDPDIDNIVYDPFDVTPPNISAVSLTLENGFAPSPYLLVQNKLTYIPTTPSEHTSRGEFTISTCTPAGASDLKEDIAAVLISTEADIVNISTSNPYWQACSTTAKAIQSSSLNDGADIPLYFYFKDASGNIAGYDTGANSSQTVRVKVDTALDLTPPPRPYVEITTPPTLNASPAQMWVNDANNCSDVDQVYINLYSRKYDGQNTEILNESQPLKTAAGWQNCKSKPGVVSPPVPLDDTFNFPIILSGSYTLNVWFKDAAGNINPDPRQVSFIFDPVSSTLPSPIAHWSFDTNHFYKNKVIDIKGQNSLSLYPFVSGDILPANGKIKEGYNLSGNKYGLTKNTSSLKPTVSVAMSVWAGIVQNEAGNKYIAGNNHASGGYGLTLESGYLRFYTNGRKAEVLTSVITTGLHNIVGTSDGRYINLYIDGNLVGTNDGGAPENIVQGTSVTFAVGVKPNAGTNYDVGDPRFFNGKIDELVIWDKFLTSTQVFRHYVDGMNILKVNESHSSPSPTLASTGFYGEFMQNALLTLPTCTDIRFVYVNETTHPPGANSHWQPCSTLPGAIVHSNLSQGYHQLKVWTKDEYDNISSSYALVDVTITGLVYQAPPEIYFTLDNQHYLNSVVRDLFSNLIGDNLGTGGATSNQTGVGFKNEGFMFNHSDLEALDALYASSSQFHNEVSLSSWLRLTQNDNRDQKISGNSDYSLYINQADNELGFAVNTTAGLRKVAVLTSTYLTGYHNVIGTYDGRYAKLYMDGVEIEAVDYGSIADISYSCMSSFTIGAGASCNLGPVANTYFNGGIDEVIVWNAALNSATISDFFNGQDNVPPLPITVEPKGNSYHVTIPIASFKANDCSDVTAVYVTLGNAKPTADTANWQTCSTDYKIKTPLLDGITNLPAETANLVHFWFKDAAGNISDTSTDVTVFHIYDFTVPDPMAYWPFDITNSHDQIASDVFGGHDATKVNTAFVIGASDEGILLNGSSSFAEVPFDSDFSLQDKVTLSAWIKIPNYPAGLKGIAGNFKDGGYGLMLNNSNLIFRVKVDNANLYDELSYDLTTVIPAFDFSKWHHVAAVYDRGQMRLFLNSMEVGTSIIPDVGPGVKPKIQYVNNNSFIIGALPTTTAGVAGGYFDGSIDEVSTFNDALTDTVIDEIFERGSNNDKTAYQVTPPEVPVNLNIIYYNSLVSRANLTVTDCTDLQYIIVTNSKFPPDKNDEDWQLCNTMTGGLLSKELSTADTYGKFWTKDTFGNISRTFNYVPITTKYDKPIQRPAAHWTFDSAHFDSGTRKYTDRIGKISMTATGFFEDLTACNLIDSPSVYGHSCYYTSPTLTLAPTTGGVLNRKVTPADQRYLYVDNTSTTTPVDKLSVATWVYITNNYDPGATLAETHIVSTWEGGKGYALRAVYDPVNPRVEFVVKPVGQPAIAPYLETKNFLTGWHLLLGTYDASTGEAKLYVDGIFTKMLTTTPANIEYTSGVKLSVGSNPNTTVLPDGFVTHCHHSMSTTCVAGYAGKKYPNSIDEVLIWKKIVTGLEASSLYHNGADVLYPTDVTAPTKPTLALENSRPKIDTNKAYFSLSSCNDISGVLVNEGTKPDKQDDRWKICRTRLGSFGINNLTPGGHTVTFWFKDLAGNVTPVSEDYVVDYQNNPAPRSNAYWPMDATHFVSNYTRDVVSPTKEHELVVKGINRDNPTMGLTVGKVNEGFNLANRGHISLYDGLTTATSSKLLRPVNYMTVGGWYYLTNSESGPKSLVDNMYNEGSSTSAAGYKLHITGTSLQFVLGLDLTVAGSNKVAVSVPTTSYSTGWHHVLGVWTGLQVKLFVDGTQVATSGNLPEENYIRYIDNSNNPLLTYFRIGASSEGNALPGNYFNSLIDEQAIWGFDLTNTQATQVYNLGMAGNFLENFSTAPDNVDNAFVYYYDQFASRVRMSLLDCTNTPYIFVGEYNAVATQPLPDDIDWRDCRTEPGAILSTKLPLGSAPQYVHVWSKNAYGTVSTIPATIEIPPVIEPDTLVLPKTYYSLNLDHFSGLNGIDFLGRRIGVSTSATSTSGIEDEGLMLGAAKYFTTQLDFNMNYTEGFTAGIWAYLTVGDATTQTLLFTPDDPQAINISITGGYLKFNIRRLLDATYASKSDYDGSFDISTDDNFTLQYPTALLPTTGWYFITASYDQQNMYLYLNGDLVATVNAPQTKYQSLVNRAIYLTTNPRIRIGNSTTSFTNKVDELMMWDFPLTQKEIIAHYIRVAHQTMSSDLTPPDTTGKTITVKESAFAASKWTSEDSNPYITINDCSDVSGIFIQVNNNTVPRYDDIGWSMCNTLDGGIQLPQLTNINGDNDIYIWIKDAAGNVNSVPLSTVIRYNQDPTPTPVAYWSFDNISLFNKFAFDYGPNHLRTELYGTTSSNHISAADQAIGFDSNRSYAKVESSSVYKPTNRLSFSYWYNTGGASSCIGDFHIFGTGNKVNGFTARIDGDTAGSCSSNLGSLIFELNLSGTRQSVRVPVSQIPSGWVHVVHVFDGRKLITYLNGGVANGGKEYKVDLNSFKTVVYDTDQDPLYLAVAPNKLAKPGVLDEYANIRFDEFAIFDHAIFPHQVTDLYNRGLAGTKIYNPARTLENNPVTLSSRFSVYQPTAAFTYGSRIKATISDCSGMDLVLVNNSTVQPSATDSDWQKCNTATGGILSSAVGSNLGSPTTISPSLWVKTFNGVVSTNYGTANNSPITMPAEMGDIPRPTAYWTFDSVSRGHQNATDVFDYLGLTSTSKPVGFSPSTVSSITEDGFSFDGVSTYLKANSSPNTNPMINISLSTWAYLKKGETSLRTLVSNSEGSSGAGLRTSNGKLEFFMYALEQAATTSTIDSDKYYYSVGTETNSYETGWHHIVGTYDGKYLRLYLDGVYLTNYQIQFYNGAYRHLVYHNDTTPWFIGAEPGATTLSGGINVTAVTANSYFDDKIDEFSIFDKTLNQSEIYYLYLYGSQFKPGIIDNAITPTDPGIALEPNAASTSNPFAYFTMPSCVGGNGEEINSVYVTFNGSPAPGLTSNEWQYCNIDPEGIISPLLNVGSNTITVYFKDNDNDISTPITFTITYTPPAMPNAMAYWSLNTAESNGSHHYLDRVGKKDLRADGDGTGYQVAAAKEAQGYQTVVYTTDTHPEAYSSIKRNWSIGLSPEKNFTTSFWYYTGAYFKTGTLFSKPGTFSISRNTSDQITASIYTTSGTVTKTSTVKMAPNSWNHITLTRNNTTAKLFLNSKIVQNFLVSNSNLVQSANQAILLDTQGVIDDVSLFDIGLNDDQILYNYYLGAKASPSDLTYVYENNATPSPIPTSYWTFDNNEIDMTAAPTRKLVDLTGSNTLTLYEDLSNTPVSYMQTGTSGSNKISNEAFFFERKETTINNPDADGGGGDSLETENITGTPEYLEAPLPVNLYSNFSIAGWVNFTKSIFHGYGSQEFYTVLDQWGPTAIDQSFRLYQTLPSPGTRSLVFQFYTTNLGPFNLTVASNPTFSSWHHIAIVRKGTIVSMIINNIEAGSINIGTTEPIRTPVSSKLRFAETNLATDEGRFEGYLDDWAIWDNKALTVEQVDEIYNTGLSGNKLIINPVLILTGSASATSVLNAPLTINDCGGFSHVYVGLVTDTPPLDTDPGWQACSTATGALLTSSLTPDSLNNIRVWFKNGATVSGYTYDFNINHVTTDNVAPVAPTISMVSSTPTNSAFSSFSLSTCTDGATTIAGVFVGATGGTPTPSQAGWTPCTTSVGGVKSYPLNEGANSVSFWFKDAAGNISLGAESFNITYNPPTLPIPNIYLPFTYNGGTPYEFSQISTYIRDSASSIPFNIVSPASATFKFFGVVDDAAEFISPSYLESTTHNPSIATEMAVAAWVNIPVPDTGFASIINQWDGNANNNRFAVTIDTTGRLCFDFQTTASAGAPNWSTNVYRHSCSLEKISFSTWNHVAVTRNGSALQFYINGLLAGTDTIEGSSLKTSNINVRVGGQQRGGSYTLQGQLDELLLYSANLTKEQVEKIYARGYNEVAVYSEIQPQATPLPFAYFDMDLNNYDLPASYMLQTEYPVNANMTLTDLDGGPATNFTTSDVGVTSESREFYSNNILESNISSIPEITNDFTMSTWVKPSLPSSGRILVNKWENPIGTPTAHATNQFKLVLDTNFGTITAKFFYHTTDSDVWNTAAYNVISSGNKTFSQSDGLWHNITVTRNGKWLSLYMDGELAITSDIGTAPFVNSTKKLLLGGPNTTTPASSYIGLIDDFTLWNKSLNERQVMKTYIDGTISQALNTTIALSAAHHSNTIKATTPTTNARLSVSDCAGFTHVLIQTTGGAQPLDGDGRWVACSAVNGAITSPNLSNGNNNLEMWMKTGSTVDVSPMATISITVSP